MGGSNPKGVNDGVGNWGQFDPMRQGHAAKFEWAGGNEQQYNSMSPEQRAKWAELANGPDFATGSKSVDAAKAWMQGQGFGNGAGGAGAGGGTRSDYTQAATPNVQSPWAQQEWTQGPDGQWSFNTNLGPGLGEANTRLQQQWAEMLRSPMDDGSGAREQAIDSAWKQAQSRLDPMWDKREEATRTRLLNQGLDPSSEANRSEMGQLGMQRNDAYTSALASAISQGTAAGNSVFQNNMAARNLPAQQMAFIKSLAAQGVPSSLLNALIAQKNNEAGHASMLQQNNTDLARAGMQFAGSAFGGLF